MNRRAFLRGVAVVSAASCAGCAGLRGGGVTVSSVTSRTTPGGVVVTVELSNSNRLRGFVELWVEVAVDGGRTYTETRKTSVGPRGSITLDVRFDVPALGSATADDYTVDAGIQPIS